MVRILKNTLPLQVFIRRAQVLQSYRQLLRATRPCEDLTLKADLQQQIKQEYRRNQALTDNNLIRSCIVEANKTLKKVQDICTPFHIKPSQDIPANDAKDSIVVKSSDPVKSSKKDPTSWLGVEDDIDPRGRVGEGWPWQS